ncbi:MAG: hypothetical protein B6245_13160 [Desulfobacteraceae bacterium 4572_88]|nr:MAG: hypothetical protein B6245_13160 [Desulfobacteraceae bacterium 4572_88]
MKVFELICVSLVLAFLFLADAGMCGTEPCKFYEHTNGRGAHFAGEPGSQTNVENAWNDRVSSVRVRGGYTLIVYEHGHFKGKRQVFSGKKDGVLYNFPEFYFNDMMSSYRIKRTGHITPGKKDRKNRQDRSDTSDRYDKKDSRKVGPQRPDRADRYDKKDSDKVGPQRPDRADRRDKSDRYDRRDVPNRPDRHDRPDRYDRRDASNRPDHHDRPDRSYTCCKFYEHGSGKGNHFNGEIGKVKYVGNDWNDEISSVWLRKGCMLTVYEHSDFKGRKHTFYGKKGGTLYNLTDFKFNDSLSSYEIRRNK